MKVSYNWLNRHIDLKNIAPTDLGNILTGLGLEVEGMEEYSTIPGNLAGVVVGKVRACENHPDADRLKVTTVDVGEEKDLQIVCGAPNIAAGQTVAVAKVNTVLYTDEGEFKIKKAKIRGVESSGMICSEVELSIGEDSDGIMVLPEDYKQGRPLTDYVDVYHDYIYDIGLTPNRSDATHHRGVARDLKAYFEIHSDEDYPLKKIDYDLPKGEKNKEISLKIESVEACPRYAGVIINNIELNQSPTWMQDLLRSIGQNPLNNIVDLTNFILHDVGQPLHAFDYDKIAGQEIRVKHLPKGTKFTTLDDKEIELREDDLMICDGENKGMCIAGVYGGKNSGVNEETKTVFLESAHFSAESVRKTSMKHFLRTDAAKIFEKGSDPSTVVDSLKRAANLLVEISGGTIASDIVEFYPEIIEPHLVNVRYQKINNLIGKDIEQAEIKKILAALEMKISKETKEAVTVLVPTDKHDVLREVDVIEEILRIYGFEQVSAVSTMNSSAFPVELPDVMSVKSDLNKMLQGMGFMEMMNVSLTDSNHYKSQGELVYINNTSNKNLDILRPDMIVSALETAAYNINHNQKDFAFYEWGKTYKKMGSAYEENHSLCLLISGLSEGAHWAGKEDNIVDFYDLKGYVEVVLQRLGLAGFQVKNIAEDTYYSYGLHYHRGPMNLVKFGKVRGSQLEEFDIDQDIYVAVFDWGNIQKNIPSSRIVYKPINKFPSISRDLALVVDKQVKYKEIEKVIRKQLKNYLTDITVFDIYEDDKIFGQDKHSLAVRMELEDAERTMNDKQIEALMNKVMKQLKTKLGIELR